MHYLPLTMETHFCCMRTGDKGISSVTLFSLCVVSFLSLIFIRILFLFLFFFESKHVQSDQVPFRQMFLMAFTTFFFCSFSPLLPWNQEWVSGYLWGVLFCWGMIKCTCAWIILVHLLIDCSMWALSNFLDFSSLIRIIESLSLERPLRSPSPAISLWLL